MTCRPAAQNARRAPPPLGSGRRPEPVIVQAKLTPADELGELGAHTVGLLSVGIDLGLDGAALGQQVADQHQPSQSQQQVVDLLPEDELAIVGEIRW